MTALELFCDVIQSEMGLEDGQVYLWDQKIDVPNDYRLYVAVSVLNTKHFGNTRDSESDGSSETLSTNVLATLSLDILSRGADARDRKEEVILALNSTYSQQQQQANAFYIAQLSTSFVNLSQIEGAAIPYRFNISVGIQYFITKTKAIQYYDTFPDPKYTVLTDP